jgi:hypothetical protein
MMTTQQLANVLQFSAVAIFWSVIIFKVVPAQRLDRFRQRMFAIRDEVFDFAADGKIAFRYPAYILLRRQINGFIRYGHHLTVFRTLMTAAIHEIYRRPTTSAWRVEWESALDSLTPSTRRAMELFHYRTKVLVIKRLLFGSPPLWIVTLVFLVQITCQGAASSAIQALKAASKKVFTGPINDRLIEEAAQGEFA